MNKIITLSLLICCFSAYSQTLPQVPCPNDVEIGVQKRIDEYFFKNKHDKDNFKIIQVLEIRLNEYDSIVFNVNKTQIYLLETKENNNNNKTTWEINLYSWDNKLNRLNLIDKDRYSKNLLLNFVDVFNSDCSYFIRLWKNSKFESLYVRADEKLHTKELTGSDEFLTTDIFNYFTSLQEYLEYSFGSVENYVETYRKRESIIHNKQIEAINRKKQGRNNSQK